MKLSLKFHFILLHLNNFQNQNPTTLKCIFDQRTLSEDQTFLGSAYTTWRNLTWWNKHAFFFPKLKGKEKQRYFKILNNQQERKSPVNMMLCNVNGSTKENGKYMHVISLWIKEKQYLVWEKPGLKILISCKENPENETVIFLYWRSRLH